MDGGQGHLIEDRHDQPDKVLIQHLVGGLGAEVDVGGQHSDMGMAVVPANDPGVHTTGCRYLVGHRRALRQLLWAGLHPVLSSIHALNDLVNERKAAIGDEIAQVDNNAAR